MQDPSRARSDHLISCCLLSLHFLCGILTTHPVLGWVRVKMGRHYVLLYEQNISLHLEVDLECANVQANNRLIRGTSQTAK